GQNDARRAEHKALRRSVRDVAGVLVPGAGVEPAYPFGRGILSLFFYVFRKFTKIAQTLVVRGFQPYPRFTKFNGF
ncbi:MAG: hypothetical protein AB7E55_06645, partial [Pigmentiphaga sp.]